MNKTEIIYDNNGTIYDKEGYPTGKSIIDDEYLSSLLKAKIFQLQCKLQNLPQHIKEEYGIMFTSDLLCLN